MEMTPRFCWGVPIIEAKNPDHLRMKDALVRISYENEQRHKATPIASGVAPKAKTNLYESPFDFFRNPAPEVQALRQFCCTALGQAIYQLDQHLNRGANHIQDVSINPFESWIHITRDGGQHDTHVHPNCSWCGIYYVDIGDCTLDPPNGVNRFYPPVDLIYEDLGSVVLPLNPVQPPPEEGKLVLFPSFVRHSGVLYRGTRDRILVSFNAQIRRAS